MTLLTTEIHNWNKPDKAVIIFAADRCVSWAGEKEGSQRKIFRIRALNAGVGFFGLAEVKNQSMESWLKHYIKSIRPNITLKKFATQLAVSLNKGVPKDYRKNVPSGFHISGFNNRRQPEFWYVRNLDDDRKTLLEVYEAREDFLSRDAARLSDNHVQIYRNGDIKAHVAVWEEIDKGFGCLLRLNDFKKIEMPKDYSDWIKFKMEMIAEFYRRYSRRSIIGKPIDSFAVTSKK